MRGRAAPAFVVPTSALREDAMSRFDLRLVAVVVTAVVLLPVSVASSQCPFDGGDCCASNGTPGCDDPVCCELICAADPFCCDTSWDGICAGAAAEQCAVCNEPQPGACCLDDGICEDLGSLQACLDAGGVYQGAGSVCDSITCPGGPGACCFADFICEDLESEAACLDAGGLYQGAGSVCDSITCPIPPCPGEGGDCCVVNGTPGCDDPVCCELICGLDPFCCDIEWDGICADEAVEFCGEVCSLPCPDTNGDLVIDAADLSNVIAGWGGLGPADVNDDGVVDVQDLVLVITSWGPCE